MLHLPASTGLHSSLEVFRSGFEWRNSVASQNLLLSSYPLPGFQDAKVSHAPDAGHCQRQGRFAAGPFRCRPQLLAAQGHLDFRVEMIGAVGFEPRSVSEKWQMHPVKHPQGAGRAIVATWFPCTAVSASFFWVASLGGLKITSDLLHG